MNPNLIHKSDFPGPNFINGDYFYTALHGLPSEENEKRIRLSYLIQKGYLRRAVISSFKYDDDLLAQLFPHDIEICMVRNDVPVQNGKALLHPFQKVTVAFPPPMQFGVMHIKLLLLEYDTFVRVAVMSANLIRIDWMLLENIVFVQDFPKIYPNSGPRSEFMCDLENTLNCLGVQESFLNITRLALDTSRCEVKLILSRNGSFSPNTNIGLYALGNFASRVCGIDNDSKLHLFMTTSSIGRLDRGYFQVFSEALRGFNRNNTNSVYNKNDKHHLLFPSVKAALSATGTEIVKKCIFFSRENLASFPIDLLYQAESKAGKYLMHEKVIVAISQGDFINKEAPKGFYYVGSHNFTKGAWGYKDFYNKLRICNYELGVVAPLHSQDQLDKKFPVPYVLPLQPFVGSEEQPWANSN